MIVEILLGVIAVLLCVVIYQLRAVCDMPPGFTLRIARCSAKVTGRTW